MVARDEYPLLVLRWPGDMTTVDQRIEQHERMCDEIDRLRAQGSMLPAENMALTVARAMVLRGEAPGVNIATVLVMALDRLTGTTAEVSANV